MESHKSGDNAICRRQVSGLHAAPTRHKLAQELSIKSDFTAISPICAHRDPPYIRPTLFSSRENILLTQNRYPRATTSDNDKLCNCASRKSSPRFITRNQRLEPAGAENLTLFAKSKLPESADAAFKDGIPAPRSGGEALEWLE
ncbi:hypothetical protein DBV15_09970 [Temnothorax longispinosus]|uniref:Uncharacterized protein n=1 Tax=Temnothorax longispinosus TaxID=300112 RepID=A0A4S2KFK7_9HYME|nr:hypothetical protein DBV15_09970 [Temnothorax longispinosus]